eukprot:1160095-Pelagomonas_calceolata.AAC.5
MHPLRISLSTQRTSPALPQAGSRTQPTSSFWARPPHACGGSPGPCATVHRLPGPQSRSAAWRHFHRPAGKHRAMAKPKTVCNNAPPPRAPTQKCSVAAFLSACRVQTGRGGLQLAHLQSLRRRAQWVQSARGGGIQDGESLDSLGLREGHMVVDGATEP